MSVQSPPPLSGAAELEQRYLTSRHFGWRVRVGSWQPARPTQGRVVILPGRGDFLEKYSQLAAFLNARGYGVYSLDWPGQGGSGRFGVHPQAGHISSYDDYGVVFSEVLSAYGLGREPVSWLAYSMGGTIALKELLRGSRKVQGAVLISPMFGFDEVVPEVLVRVLVDGAHRLGLGRRFALGEGPTDVAKWSLVESRVSSGAEAFRAFKAFLLEHPQLLLSGSSWGWVRASLAAFSEVRRADLSQIQTPTLLVSAEDEQTVSASAQASVARRLPNATFISIPGKHNLLLNDRDKVDRLFNLIADFVARSAREGTNGLRHRAQGATLAATSFHRVAQAELSTRELSIDKAARTDASVTSSS